jgi:neutral trehalase
VDVQIVNAEERPSSAEYDLYAYLVGLFASRNYDESRIRQDCPLLVQDVLFNTLRCQANRDLAEIACILGEDVTPFEAWAEGTAEAINAKLWNDEHAIYVDFDSQRREPMLAHAAAGFAPLYAEIPNGDRAQRMCSYLNTACFCGLDEACYAVPSYDKHEPDYSPGYYWRGPIWININWLLYRGLLRYGFHK